MAKAPTLSDVGNIMTSATIINENWDAIQEAFENTLSLDGSTPNAMLADLDLNDNDLLNVGTMDAELVRAERLEINGSDIATLVGRAETAADNAEDSEVAAANSAAVATQAAVDASLVANSAATLLREETITGDGTDTYTLTQDLPMGLVFVDGLQKNGDTFTHDPAGRTLTFDGSVPVGSKIDVYYSAGTAAYSTLTFENRDSFFNNKTVSYYNTPVGATIVSRREGFRYVVAPSIAADEHLTINGVKYYVAADSPVNIMALGVDDTGTVNCTNLINRLVGYASEIVFPAGTFSFVLDQSASLVLTGAGPEQTVISSVYQANGSAITVGGPLTLRGLTVKCHPTDVSAHTISNYSSHYVQATNVYFDGVNHAPAGGVDSVADYSNCKFISYDAPNSLGAKCYSAKGKFWNCEFLGGRTIEACDSQFYFCTVFSDTNAVHMPTGALDNDGNNTGFTGKAGFYDCNIYSNGSGVTCGNAGHPILRRTNIYAAIGSTGGGAQALYLRSESTADAEDSKFVSQGVGVGITDLGGPGNILKTGVSTFKRCQISGEFNSLAVPPTSENAPSSIGNAYFYDCDIVGGDSSISPNTSTYHIIGTELNLAPLDVVQFPADNTTARFRFKGNNMTVGVTGSDGPRVGCSLSHLDAVTGLPHKDGTEIYLKYNGVSSRYVTFNAGNTADGGSMRFANDAATLATTQFGVYKLRLYNTSWRQV